MSITKTIAAAALALAASTAGAQQVFPSQLLTMEPTGEAAGYYFKQGQERPESFNGFYGLGTAKLDVRDIGIPAHVTVGVTPMVNYGLIMPTRKGETAKLGMTGYSAMLHIWIGDNARVTQLARGHWQVSVNIQF